MTSDTLIEATLAFVFDKKLSKVLLIKKEKPIAHAGLLNGLGGKLEIGESYLECVIREIDEEAGIPIPKKEWQNVGELCWENWKVSIWTSFIEIPKDQSFTDKNVGWYAISPLPKNCIENLEWLIPLCVDVNKKIMAKAENIPKVKIKY